MVNIVRLLGWSGGVGPVLYMMGVLIAGGIRLLG